MVEATTELEARLLVGTVESHIVVLRRQRVLLSGDLARLYGVEPRALVQAVKRNTVRFPPDFCFQLTRDESTALKSQTVIAGRGGARTPPYAFTEQGVAMLSSVLQSQRAIAVNIEIMRTFVRLRAMLASSEDLGRQLAALEERYDERFRVVFDAIRELTTPPEGAPRQRIGFVHDR